MITAKNPVRHDLCVVNSAASLTKALDMRYTISYNYSLPYKFHSGINGAGCHGDQSIIFNGHVFCPSHVLTFFHGKATVTGKSLSLFTKRMVVLSSDHWKIRWRYIQTENLSDRFEIWQASRQHCYRDTCHILERGNNFNTPSHRLKLIA